MKKIAALIFITLFISCAASKKFAPTTDEMPLLQQKVAGITFTEAQQGYVLYVKNCSNCHRLHNPAEFTAEKWETILPEMFEKAKLSRYEDQQLLHNYIIAKSKTEKPGIN